MLEEYRAFLEGLVSQLVAQQKSIRNTDNPAINELMASAHENPHSTFKTRAALKLADITGNAGFGVDIAQLRTKAEALQREYEEKLKAQL